MKFTYGKTNRKNTGWAKKNALKINWVMFKGRDLQIKKSFECSLCNLFWDILQSFKPKNQTLNELWDF